LRRCGHAETYLADGSSLERAGLISVFVRRALEQAAWILVVWSAVIRDEDARSSDSEIVLDETNAPFDVAAGPLEIFYRTADLGDVPVLASGEADSRATMRWLNR